MRSIAEAMSNFSGAKHTGGISGRMEHPEVKKESPEGEHGSVPDHLKALHAEHGGTHMHVHQHEGGFTSHHVKDDGKVEGPHEHGDSEELKSHMDKVFNDHDGDEGETSEHDGLL